MGSDFAGLKGDLCLGGGMLVGKHVVYEKGGWVGCRLP